MYICHSLNIIFRFPFSVNNEFDTENNSNKYCCSDYNSNSFTPNSCWYVLFYIYRHTATHHCITTFDFYILSGWDFSAVDCSAVFAMVLDIGFSVFSYFQCGMKAADSISGYLYFVTEVGSYSEQGFIVAVIFGHGYLVPHQFHISKANGIAPSYGNACSGFDGFVHEECAVSAVFVFQQDIPIIEDGYFSME